MSSLIRKVLLGVNALMGFLYKFLVDLHIIGIPQLDTNNSSDVIVSLTSYGRRVKTNVVYYTLVSILRQTIQPSHIILWLADDEWNDDTLPLELKSLKGKGVEICYCEDIKSYKKLIPTIKEYPDKDIITIDDDVIYSRDFLKTLLDEHRIYPHDILCTVARKPIFKEGIPCEYSKWGDSLIKPFERGTYGKLLFPVGVGGVLYPVNALHKDVTKAELFMKYCPNADDIWFWICGLRNNTVKRYIIKRGTDISFDSLYQYFHKGSALTHSNNFQNQNDIQINKLFEYYENTISVEEDVID